MKKKFFKLLCLVPLLNLSASSFSASFVDSLWNGKTVSEEMVCSDYNMDSGSTPEILLENISKNSNKVILEFSDETFKGMRNGGHGVISYNFKSGLEKIVIPSVEGETFDLPDGFKSIKEHRAGKYGKERGAYLAPCSGGKGNTYSVLIKVMNDNKILDITKLTLGIY